jgi:hypothetical protein
LYVYASKAHAHGGFLAVLAFFIVMFYFLNYQAVPFSLALGLLFLLFMLETQKKSGNVMLTMLVLYVSISIMHAFVPLFFVLYLLMRSIVSRSKQYLNLFILTSIVYFLVQFTLAQFSFPSIITSMMTFPAEYSSIVSSTLAPVSVITDVVAQAFSRMVTIGFAMTCFAGFVILVIRRKMREMDKAIFLTGAVYSGFGVVIYTLGSRALPIVFIPISLGVLYLFESKYKLYVAASFIILLSLFAFIPLHNSFYDGQINFQTREARETADFVISRYNWNLVGSMLAHVTTKWYIYPQVEGHTVIETDMSVNLSSGFYNYQCVIYSVGLAKSFQRNNISEEAFVGIMERYNVIYDSGPSYVVCGP